MIEMSIAAWAIKEKFNVGDRVTVTFHGVDWGSHIIDRIDGQRLYLRPADPIVYFLEAERKILGESQAKR